MAEEIILTGDDLMASLPSPVIPADMAPQVLQGMDVCARELRALFQCLHINEVEPFCQDHILVYRRCSLARDKEIRERLVKAEVDRADHQSDEENKAHLEALRTEVTSLNRQMILFSAMEGPEGFQARWRLNGEVKDVESRAKALEEHADKKANSQPQQHPEAQRGSRNRFWFF